MQAAWSAISTKSARTQTDKHTLHKEIGSQVMLCSFLFKMLILGKEPARKGV